MSARKRIVDMVSTTDPGQCWLWLGTIDPRGYARLGGLLGHRRSYEELVGPIPAGLTLDHVCHTHDKTCPGGPSCQHRRCVNPEHLEPVTMRENTLRGRGLSALYARRDHCGRGHRYTVENTRVVGRRRYCRACDRIRDALRAPARSAS